MKLVRWARLLALFGTSALCLILTPSRSAADIVSAAGTVEIAMHSSLYPDGALTPSNTSGVIPFVGLTSHEAFAPFGFEHGRMKLDWNLTPNVFVPNPTGPATATQLELVPSPPVPAPHSATITGSFDLDYALDAAGLPATLLPARVYQIFSYVSPLPLSPAAASFDAQWNYFDVDGATFLGSQIIHYDAPAGLNVLNTVSSLPLAIAVPAGNTTLRVTGFFMLSTTSDVYPGFGPPPFDTLIGVVPEPSTFVLVVLGLVGLGCVALRKQSHQA